MVYLDQIAEDNELRLHDYQYDFFAPPLSEIKNVTKAVIHSSWITDGEEVKRAKISDGIPHWVAV